MKSNNFPRLDEDSNNENSCTLKASRHGQVFKHLPRPNPPPCSVTGHGEVFGTALKSPQELKTWQQLTIHSAELLFSSLLLAAEPCTADGAVAGPGHGDTSAGGFWLLSAVAFTEWDGVSS